MKPHEFILFEIALEREYQMQKPGWSPADDDTLDDGQLAMAAGDMARGWHTGSVGRLPPRPDASYWWPSDPRRNLIKAAALIVAEIERLDRIPLPPEAHP